MDLIGKRIVMSVGARSSSYTVYVIKDDLFCTDDSHLHICKDDGTGVVMYEYSPDTIRKHLKAEVWFLVATDAQVEWMCYLRDFKWDLRQSMREMIQRIMSRPVPYYTMADRENLNFLREQYGQ